MGGRADPVQLGWRVRLRERPPHAVPVAAERRRVYTRTNLRLDRLWPPLQRCCACATLHGPGFLAFHARALGDDVIRATTGHPKRHGCSGIHDGARDTSPIEAGQLACPASKCAEFGAKKASAHAGAAKHKTAMKKPRQLSQK